ncbi:hypothetical protein ABNF97_18190 [Plantactinospora sp. B6F1]|uniref:hypothetical protein n=1 Tax=Plantactinospora sp. B6F1 TaxID=3158971 RepID=UPI0032D95237
MAQPPARPTALYLVLALVLLGSLLTFVDWYLDRRVLTVMFLGNGDMDRLLPTFTTGRLVGSVLGVVVALGLSVLTFLGLNWARVLLALTCLGFAVVNIGAAIGAGFTLVAGRGAFNEGGDATSTDVSILNGASLANDVVLLLLVLVCAGILFFGKTKAYTKARAGTH